MGKSVFPDDPSAVVGVLVELFRHQKQDSLVKILEAASPEIEQTGYDSWNGGTYSYTLNLRIPLKLFASIESQIQALEAVVHSKFTSVFRELSNQLLSSVIICPATDGISRIGTPKVQEEDLLRIWGELPFRLFISHVSAHKENVSKLKVDLAVFGISGFVAHEDITPGIEFQEEMEKALHSMNGLVALLTTDFHQSAWTDQEVGFAMGRKIPVIGIRLGQDPYGFIGRQQGLPGNFADTKNMAEGIVEILLRNDHAKKRLQEALIFSFEKAINFAASKAVIKKLEYLEYISDDDLSRLELACESNDQVGKSWGVPERVKKLREKFTGVPF